MHVTCISFQSWLDIELANPTKAPQLERVSQPLRTGGNQAHHLVVKQGSLRWGLTGFRSRHHNHHQIVHVHVHVLVLILVLVLVLPLAEYRPSPSLPLYCHCIVDVLLSGHLSESIIIIIIIIKSSPSSSRKPHMSTTSPPSSCRNCGTSSPSASSRSYSPLGILSVRSSRRRSGEVGGLSIWTW